MDVKGIIEPVELNSTNMEPQQYQVIITAKGSLRECERLMKYLLREGG